MNKNVMNENGFAFRFALKQRHKGTRKWPILCISRRGTARGKHLNPSLIGQVRPIWIQTDIY